MKHSALRLLSTVLLGLWVITAAASEVITVNAPLPANQAIHDYFHGLLTLALEKTQKDFGPFQIRSLYAPLEQGRALKELAAGRFIDIYWAGTTIEREQKLRPIRIPLIRGALGYRMAIIRKEFSQEFSQIRKLKQLQQYTACQGAYWPDADILERAGIKVFRSSRYTQLFGMVSMGRCDFFPRAIFEGATEIQAIHYLYPNLEWNQQVLLHYPFPLYYFVAKKNRQLARRIERGLTAAIDDGSFIQYMRRHRVTAQLFPASQWLNKRTIVIPNKDLSPQTPFSNKALWFH